MRLRKTAILVLITLLRLLKLLLASAIFETKYSSIFILIDLLTAYCHSVNPEMSVVFFGIAI